MDPAIPFYADHGALRDQDRVALEDFLEDHDRTELTGRGVPFFSGREAEINRFREVARRLSRGRSGNSTIIVEGVPGAGKSALLAQFEEEMRSFPPVGDGRRRWLPVRMRGSRAESPQAVQQAVDEAIAERLSRDLLRADAGGRKAAEGRLIAFLGQQMRKVGKGVGEIAQAVLDRGGGAFGLRIGAAPAGASEDIETVAERRAEHWGDWQIVLLIDEAQMVSVPGNGTLDALHQGLVKPSMSFCAFGLLGTMDALTALGISRPTDGRYVHLSGLGQGASRTVVRRCFGQYGVTHGAAWEDAILERSANWPQHLTAYLNAALTVLKDNAPSPKAMGDARQSTLGDALTLGDQARARYYGQRLSSLTRTNPLHLDYAHTLVTVLQGANRPVLLSAAARAVMEAHQASVSEAADFLRQARRAGLVACDLETRCSLPIPSFANHLLSLAMEA